METAIQKSVDALRRGQTLLYPTDTVWGLGCDATNAEAVGQLYALKQRDPSRAMLILAAPEWVPPDNPAGALLHSAERPTTVVMPASLLPFGNRLATNLLAADGTVGVRLPKGSPFCLALLQAYGLPVVSTSANLSGKPPAATRSEIAPALVAAVGYAVPAEAGNLGTNAPSRIVRLENDGSITILRP
ncbi:MAG: L-threonylcarbamoyladenylate synthase [Bacteroidales bacterium]|nr:L-threonylcarbamoyladenylate synthase [Bacteroidales bacterium]